MSKGKAVLVQSIPHPKSEFEWPKMKVQTDEQLHYLEKANK